MADRRTWDWRPTPNVKIKIWETPMNLGVEIAGVALESPRGELEALILAAKEALEQYAALELQWHTED